MPNRPSLSSWVCNCPQMVPPHPPGRCSRARCECPRAAHVDSGATPPHRGDAGGHRARSLRGGGCAFAASLHGVRAASPHTWRLARFATPLPRVGVLHRTARDAACRVRAARVARRPAVAPQHP
eukprot:7273876-Prymnesium_polylepis.1